MAVSLSSTDLTRMTEASRLLLSPLASQAAGVDTSAWMQQAGGAVRDLVGGESVVVMAPSAGGRYVSDDAPDIADDLRRFVASAGPSGLTFTDPFLQAWSRIRLELGMEVFTWADTQRVAEAHGFRMNESAVIGDILLSRRLNDYSVIVHDLPDGPSKMFLLHRKKGGFAFGAETPTVLQAILPSFHAGIDALSRLGQNGTALDAVAEPLIVFDADGRERHRSAALVALLASDPQQSTIEVELARLARGLRRLGYPRRSDRRALPAPGEHAVATSRRRYVFRGAILPPGAYGPDEAFVITVDPEVGGPSPRALQERFGLTAREAEVTLLLARGLSNADIAEKLFIAPGTVKRHTENVLAKLEVRSRAAVAARIA